MLVLQTQLLACVKCSRAKGVVTTSSFSASAAAHAFIRTFICEVATWSTQVLCSALKDSSARPLHGPVEKKKNPDNFSVIPYCTWPCESYKSTARYRRLVKQEKVRVKRSGEKKKYHILIFMGRKCTQLKTSTSFNRLESIVEKLGDSVTLSSLFPPPLFSLSNCSSCSLCTSGRGQEKHPDSRAL